MRSIVHRLTPKDKKALALFYETDAYLALMKLIKAMTANAATHSLTATDWEAVKLLQGQAFSLKELKRLLEEINKLDQKN